MSLRTELRVLRLCPTRVLAGPRFRVPRSRPGPAQQASPREIENSRQQEASHGRTAGGCTLRDLVPHDEDGDEDDEDEDLSQNFLDTGSLLMA